MADETLLEHVADIVSAHVSNNAVLATELPDLIQSVYTALTALGKAPEPAIEQRVPAVSIRSSVKADALICLECGQRLKLLKRHLHADHGLTPDEYRDRWGLPGDYPMAAPDYSALRKGLAVKNGLGRKRG